MSRKHYADLLIHGAAELVTMAAKTNGPRCGGAMNRIAAVKSGAVAVANGRILIAGPENEVMATVKVDSTTRQISAKGRLVTPGLVDAHTHLVFAGSRENEFELKIVQGLSYEEIEDQGGGVLATVKQTREASMTRLIAQARPVLHRMLKNGVTTVEAKSGYALTAEGEIKLLQAMEILNHEGPQEIIPTLFGAHDLPPEYSSRSEDFLSYIIDEMIPAVAEKGLARFYDSGVTFPPDDTAKLFAAAKAFGLGVKVHADEFALMGGAALAARCGAASAEHCLNSRDEDLEAMRQAGVIAVLLPAVPIIHRLGQFVDARRFIDNGLAVALGTDFNPSCPVESLSMVMSLACYTAGMHPAEAVTAATINAAYAVGCGHEVGSLEPGKQADIVIWEVANHLQLCANPSSGLAATVIKKGQIILEDGCPCS